MKWKKVYKDGTIREVDMKRDGLFDIGLDAWLDHKESKKGKKGKKGKNNTIFGIPIWLFILLLIVAFPLVILWGIISASMNTLEKDKNDKK